MTVQSNHVALLAFRESSIGVPGAQAVVLTPNTLEIGAENVLVTRDPISKNAMELEGTIVDRDSKFSMECDLTMEALQYLGPLAFLADYNGPSLLADGAPYYPTSVDSTDYVVASGGAVVEGRLIYARGFAVTGNNGLKVVGASSTSTEIKASGLAAETTTAAQNATVEVCGVQGATADITINADLNIETTLLDCTTLGLTDGQFIWIGGDSGTAALNFATAANRGLARVRGTVTATIIPLDKTDNTLVADAGTGKTIQIFFGRFLRRVAVDNADYAKHSTTFEAEWPTLTNAFEASRGNVVNTCKINLPGQSKATMQIEAIGTDTDDPAATTTTGGATARIEQQDALFNTSSQLLRSRITKYDESALTARLKSAAITFGNNANPSKWLGIVGAADVNVGKFSVAIEGQGEYGDDDLLEVINDAEVVTAEFAMRNPDGGFVLDLPSVQLGSGKREMPKDAEVLVTIQGRAVKDATLGYPASISLFPWLPE